jgi:hypothetical protein
MLHPQEAQKRLQAFKIKNWQKQRVEQLGALPEKLRAAGRALLDRDPAGKPFKGWERAHKARTDAGEALAKMTARDRQRVFAVFFPRLAGPIEGAWQLLARLPYGTGYDRKAFRAPSDPAAWAQARVEFLTGLIGALGGYDPDIAWCAAWAAHVSSPYEGDKIGLLLAAALDAGAEAGEEVFGILRDSATNDHEVGRVGRHVTRALLVASRPDGWEFVEKLLLAAQRQEGLRQVILETIDEAHPQAFRRMLRLILEHNLVRFSATVRAVDVWFGLRWDSVSAGVVKNALETVRRFLEDPAARAAAVKKEEGETLYFALWALGFEDAAAAVGPAAALLGDPVVERRFIALHFLSQLELPAAREAAVRCLEDADLRIAVRALDLLPAGADLWDRLVALRERLPAKRDDAEELVWPWETTVLDRRRVVGLLVEHLGRRPATALLPFLGEMESYQRANLVERLGQLKKWDAATRDTLFRLVGDRDGWVRQRALEALKKCEVGESDALVAEGLLSRKGSELRQGVLRLLAKQKTPAALASADRLLAGKKAEQRLGGLELLSLLAQKKRGAAECRRRAEEYRAARPALEEDEQAHLEAILDEKREKPTLENALGLMDPARRTAPTPPAARKVALCTPAALGCLQALDALYQKHGKAPVRVTTYQGEEEALLGNLNPWMFPSPDPTRPAGQDAADRLPLCAVWQEWWANRPRAMRDADGLELVRALAWCQLGAAAWRGYQKKHGKTFAALLKFMSNGQTPPKLRRPQHLLDLVKWLLRLHPPAGAVDFLLDAVETAYAMAPEEALRRVVDLKNWNKRERDWRVSSPAGPWEEALEVYQSLAAEALTEAQAARLWRLHHWRDRPAPGVGRVRPPFESFVAACKAGLTNEADQLDTLLGEPFDETALESLTRPGSPELQQCPALAPLLDRCRERILEVELKRGETPTAASGPAKAVRSLPGLAALWRVLAALGKKPFARTQYGDGRAEVLTHLVQATHPTADDAPGRFAEGAKALALSRERLLQLAFVAPQWLDGVEQAVSWPGLKEAVWWFLAHTPYGRAGVGLASMDETDDEEEDDEGAAAGPQSAWARVLRERTPLGAADRRDGAVDAGWFHRAYGPLGPKRWGELAGAAKFGCADNGYKKAVMLADVLLGKVKKGELVADIRDRKLKGSVRYLGLLPLPEGEKREAELLARYKVLHEYRRYARGLGPMSREESVRAATVGLENLARTAGYPDPIRLEWAMEAREIADLAAGPVSVTHDGVTVTLAIDEQAQPEITVRRGEKPLKAVPPSVRKNPKVAALAERRADLKRSASRVKQSLEQAMCRGDAFTGGELKDLFGHPLLRPLLERLVLIGEGVRGYPTAGGQALEDHAGKLEPVKANERLRIAHPHDLFAAGDWDRWQADCFRRERVQPFKQVFRELYVVTQQERAGGAVSHRYAGQQVNPTQARALWGARGWSVREDVTKTFHDLGWAVEVSFRDHGWTALEVEGLTLDGVSFRRRDDHRPAPLDEVPPRLFSEVMRDCDLVVSVAHRGGVDPEASASTVEMRAALLRETCGLLNVTNYRFAGSHVLIDGTLGAYSVHLGSAVVHRQPGGALCIVPVHAQHRGRLFLPFADDDPRTAEVVSKVLLLARDHEIQDPSILEQLR